MRPGLYLLVLIWASTAAGQTIDAQAAGQRVQLTKTTWRFHQGDDSLWASPQWDDTGWPIVRAGKNLSEQGFKRLEGYCWYRARIVLPNTRAKLALNMNLAQSTYEVFVDGARARNIGPDGPPREWDQLIHSFEIRGKPQGDSVLVAIRFRISKSAGRNGFGGFGPYSGASLSTIDDSALLQNNRISSLVRYYVPGLIPDLLGILVGLWALGLYWPERHNKEYLWLAVCGFSFNYLPECFIGFGLVPGGPISVAGSIASAGVTIGLMEFGLALAKVQLNRWFRCFESLFILFPLAEIAIVSGWAPESWSNAVYLALNIPAALIVVPILVREYRRGNREILNVLLPAFLIPLAADEQVLNALANSAGHSFNLPQSFPVGPLVFTAHQTGFILFWLCTGFIMLRRAKRIGRERERMAAEFQAAKTIQDLLLPSERIQIPGFLLETAYHPSFEVGGDFFQVIPKPGGAVALLVGDVSGKGMKAAMIVSMIVGALRRDDSETPCMMMARLNDVLIDQTGIGFVTCLIAWFALDGRLTLVNAGHIPPYLNGHDVVVEGNLPLGVARDDEFEETTLRLVEGDRLTFCSDGVIEARNRRKELLGFEKAAELSRKGAAEIASAARDFGQEDDITVIAVEMLHAPRAVAV